MNIFLNGVHLDVDGITSEETLESLLQFVALEIKEKGLIIAEIKADGTSFDSDETDKLKSRKLIEFQTIEIFAATAKDFLNDAVEESTEAFPYIEEMSHEVSSKLRIGKVKEAMDKQIELIDGLEWLTMVLENLEIGFAESMTESSFEIRRRQLLKKLEERMDALESMHKNQDWVGMADVLEYEFPELFRTGIELFSELKSRKNS